MATQRPGSFGDVLSLRDAMNRLMEQSFVRSRGVPRSSPLANLDIPIDCYDTGDAYVLRALVPGAHQDDVQLTVLGNSLEIRGQIHMHRTDQREVCWLIHEIPHGSFARVVTLPQRANPDGATASFEAGILTVRLPKAQEARPREIKITPSGR